MYPYIVCFCGRSLGDIYDLFIEMRRQKINAALDGEEPVAFELAQQNIQLNDILDALHIRAECCRVRMLTQVEFKNYY